MTYSDMFCRLDAEQQPWATRDIDGLQWPGSYAAGVLARYRRQYGDGAMLRDNVCQHVEFVCGWSNDGKTR